MDVQVIEATVWDQPTFSNLFQFYLYEFSRFTRWRVTYAGRFIELDLQGCWTAPTRHPFLIRVDNDLAGFAIVDDLEQSTLSDERDVRELSEFFVMGAYRRRGIGRVAAFSVFDRFPGRWEVRQMAANVFALPFWRKIVAEYTGGDYREQTFDDERWKGTAQFFNSRKL